MLETGFPGWKKRGSPQGRARFTGATERCPSWVPPMSQLPATRLTLAPSSSVCLSVCLSAATARVWALGDGWEAC